MPAELSPPRPPRAGDTILSSSTRPTGCSTPSCPSCPPTCRPCSPKTGSSSSRHRPASIRSSFSPSGRAGPTAPFASPCSRQHERQRPPHRDLPGQLRPRHARPPRHHQARGRDLRPGRRRGRPRAEPQADDVLGRGTGGVPRGSAPPRGQRRGRRLRRARRRVRQALGRQDDGQRVARDLRLRVGVPDAPLEPHARAGRRDRLPDVEPAVQLRLVERGEGSRVLRRERGRARPRCGGPPLRRDVSAGEARRARFSAGVGMPPRNITAALLRLLVAALLPIAIYPGAWRGGSEGPGYLAVIDTCGILTIRSDDSHWRFTCLQGIYAAVSVSGDGKTIAWDTKTSIVVANADTTGLHNALLPTGTNTEPSLSPDGRTLAFLHSPRDDGRYDIWTGSTTLENAEQLTALRDVSSVAWSPAGDWIAYVKGWSPQTLEGDIVLARPSGSGERA